MTENRRGKKKIRRRLTRFELTRALHVGLTTVDRLIAFGLRPIARRGRAKLYDPQAARRLAERLAPADSAASDVLIADYTTHAHNLHDRRQTVMGSFIPDEAWRPAWRGLTGLVAQISAPWPRHLAGRLASMTSQEASQLHLADSPRVPPAPPAAECAAAERLLRTLLASDGWPRLETEVLQLPAVDSIGEWIMRRTAISLGITITPMQGDRPALWQRPELGRRAWLEPETRAAIADLDAREAERRYPKPLLRPLLEEVAQSVSTSSEVRALQAALSVAVAPASPPLPQTVDDARVAWRAARSSYRQARVAVRHGHRRRAELVAQIPLAIQRWRARWWHARRELVGMAGDPAQLRAFVENVHREALAQLEIP